MSLTHSKASRASLYALFLLAFLLVLPTTTHAYFTYSETVPTAAAAGGGASGAAIGNGTWTGVSLGWHATSTVAVCQFTVKLAAVGVPTDSVQLQVYSQAATSTFGASIKQTLVATAVTQYQIRSTSPAPVTFNFAPCFSTAAGTWYNFYVSRTGTASSSNYYGAWQCTAGATTCTTNGVKPATSIPAQWVVDIESADTFHAYTQPTWMDFSLGTTYVDASTTQITSVIPIPLSLVATSSSETISISGYINPSDWTSSSVVFFDYASQGTSLDTTSHPVGGLFAGGNYQSFSIPSPGNFTVSGTFDGSTQGEYEFNAVIRNPKYNIFGIPLDLVYNVLYSYGWQATLGTSTSAEKTAVANIIGVQNALGFINTAVVQDSNCTPSGSFSVSSCISYLFVPSLKDLQNFYADNYKNFFSKVPFGYVARFVTIVTGNATPVEPPALSYTFGSSSPAVLQGNSITLQPFDHFDVITTIKADDGTNKNIWDIVDPWFTLVSSLAVLTVILSDILGGSFALGGGDADSGGDGGNYQPETDASIRAAVKKGGGMGLAD